MLLSKADFRATLKIYRKDVSVSFIIIKSICLINIMGPCFFFLLFRKLIGSEENSYSSVTLLLSLIVYRYQGNGITFILRLIILEFFLSKLCHQNISLQGLSISILYFISSLFITSICKKKRTLFYNVPMMIKQILICMYICTRVNNDSRVLHNILNWELKLL